MTRAVAYLDQTLKALDAYRNVSAARAEHAAVATPPEENK